MLIGGFQRAYSHIHTDTNSHACRNVYSPHIAPGGQPKTPFFLLFIQACCQFFLLLRPGGFVHLPLLLLFPLPVPPLPTAVQVQLCRWWGESRRHARSSQRHTDAAGFKARRTYSHTHLHTHHCSSTHTDTAEVLDGPYTPPTHAAGLSAAGWRLWRCVFLRSCREESVIQPLP